jgi:hypothetical protein
MPTQPGSPAAQMPSDEGGMARRVQEIERALLELGPSIAGSILPVVLALPVPVVDGADETGWQATNGGVLATVTIPWVAGKTACSVGAWLHGFYQADIGVPQSDRPAFYLGVQGAYGAALPSIPGNTDTYFLVGSHATSVTVATNVVVTLKSVTGASLSAASPDNEAHVQALAIFS